MRTWINRDYVQPWVQRKPTRNVPRQHISNVNLTSSWTHTAKKRILRHARKCLTGTMRQAIPVYEHASIITPKRGKLTGGYSWCKPTWFKKTKEKEKKKGKSSGNVWQPFRILDSSQKRESYEFDVGGQFGHMLLAIRDIRRIWNEF